MKKNLVVLIAVFIVISGISFFYSLNNQNRLLMANIEALTLDEELNGNESSGLVFGNCLGLSTAYKCAAMCLSCQGIWETGSFSGGPASDVRGRCFCGGTHFVVIR
ncbi:MULTISPECIES: hypothetical protein [Alistipes]|nr:MULTISPECIES: hypothetical protein [Alistipes]MBQ4904127.1 hypothetical protein [Alistipes sp. Marseille-P2263]MCI2259425.1 NVEALA domain-containing protein [Alistipes dispar]